MLAQEVEKNSGIFSSQTYLKQSNIICSEIIFLNCMNKKQSKVQTQSLKRILNLMAKIRSKLLALGYSTTQSKQKILKTISNVLLNVPTQNYCQMVVVKLKLKSLHRRTYQSIISELDLLYHSVYDNFQSQSQHPQVKIQNLENNEKGNLNNQEQQKNQLPQFAEMRPYRGRLIYGKRPSFLRSDFQSSEEFRRLLLRRRQIQLQNKNLEAFFQRKF